MIRVIGIDPGSVKMGYGLIQVESGMASFLAAGILKAPASWDVPRRLHTLFGDLVALLREFRPTMAGVEAGFVKGQMGALTSGAARGAAMIALREFDIDPKFYAPTSVKKAAAGHGAATKDQVCRMVQATLHMNRTPVEDAGDALAVALTRARDTP